MRAGRIFDLAKGSLVYGLGGVINRVLNLLLLPVFTSYLNPEDYGIIALVAILTLFLTGLFSLGTGNSMGICFFESPVVDRNKIVWNTFYLVAVNGLVLSGLSIYFAPAISSLLFGKADNQLIITLAIIAFLFQSMSSPFLSYLRLEKRAKLFVLVNTVTVLTGLILNIVFVVLLGRGVTGMFEASLISSFVLLVLTLATAATKLGTLRSLEKDVILKLVKIGFPSVFGLGAFYIIDWSDRILIERLLSVEAVGIYFVGYSFGMIINMIVDAFGNAWPPYFISFINKKEEASVLFGKIFKYYLMGLGLVTLCFFLFAKPVVMLITNIKYIEAYTVIGIIACSYMLKGSYLIMLPGLNFEKRLGIQSVIEWVSAGVNFGLNLLLIPLFQIEGAALATLISYISLNILCYIISNHFFRVHYEWGKLSIFALFYMLIAISSYFPIGPIWAGIVFNLMLISGFAIFAFFFVMDAGERRFLYQLKWTSFH